MRQMLLHAENHAILARLILQNAPSDATCVRLAQKLQPNGYLVEYDKGMSTRPGYASLSALAQELGVSMHKPAIPKPPVSHYETWKAWRYKQRSYGGYVMH